MSMIKKLLGALALTLSCTAALAAGGDFPLERAPKNINDMASLQHGAKLFVNYCLNCHSANSMRYNKLADIGLTDDQIRDNLLFSGEKIGDLMHIAMTPQDAKKWFGTTPPDLSVIARAKSINAGPSGADYLYTYLRTFYRDASKASGWDNLVFPSVGMPHVMWAQQGPRELTRTEVHKVAKDGAEGWERVKTTYDAQGFVSVEKEPLANYTGHGSVENRFKALDPAAARQFDQDVADLTNFMAWMAEPVKRQRQQLGVWVLLFLGVFFVVAWRLNASYWKHVK